ncbi:MAG: hypothetical protein LQ349_006833 [Xanthoria aureola]|nr:MAG: hypothetical protein LQ349_006833 [Xanthoria aureola]
MSFGWSVSDIASLVQLAYKTSQGARAACGQYDDLTRETSSLHVVLNRLKVEAAKPGNPINKDKAHGKELAVIADGCKDILTQLDKVLVKYNALSEQERSVRRLWKKIRFGNGVVADVAALRSKITYYASSLTLFLNMISLGTIGTIEEKMDKAGGDLQDIKIAVNHITAHLMATAGEEGSVLTAHTNDDRGAWRELRRRLLKDGFQDSLVRKHMDIIMAYVKELGDRGMYDNTTIHEAEGGGTMPEPHGEASPATKSDVKGNTDDEDLSGPDGTPQHQVLPEQDDQNTGYTSNIEGATIKLHDDPDISHRLNRIYGSKDSYWRRYDTLKFFADLHDFTIYVVDPSVSELLDAFYFRYMAIGFRGLSPVTEDFRTEGKRILWHMNDSFDADTRHYLRSMRIPPRFRLHATCNVFSVDTIRANDARESSVQILIDMQYWVACFDQDTHCRACVDARLRRFCAVRHSDREGTERWQALHGYPDIEDFETLDFWHDTYESHQTKASALLRVVDQRYRSLRYSGSNARSESNVPADYELPAFVSDQAVIYKLGEIRATSDPYSKQSSEASFLQDVRLLGIIEKQPVRSESLNINTIPGEPGVTVYWTPNGLAVSAINLMLHDVDQSFAPGRIDTLCGRISIEILKAFIELEQHPPEYAAAILPLHWDGSISVQYHQTIDHRHLPDFPAIRIHRYPNNTLPW